MSNPTEELVKNVLNTKFEAFSNEQVEDVKKRFIDVIGCAIGGANASGNSIILDLVREWGGKKEATILCHGDRVPVHHAAMLNSIMCRSYDYEVILEVEGEAAGRMTGHICATIVPTALAVAEQRGSSGKDLIIAVILGADLAARIATAEDFSFDHSFDNTGTMNGFGAAAAAGRLRGLNETQMLNAFGIVVNQIAGSLQHFWDGAHTFKLPGALAASNGIVSVELASRGFTGLKDPLMSKHGYFAQYCKSYRPEFLTIGLGKRFYTKGAHKLHPGCYGNHVAIECGLELHRQYDIPVENIEEVIVGVNPMMYQTFLNQPFEMGDPQMKASFNIPYNVANVLLRKSVRLEHFTDAFLQDPKVIELVKKVKLVPRAEASTMDFVRGWAEKAWATDLKVRMKDGKELSVTVETAARGRLNNPLTKDEIKDKFRANVAFSKTVSKKNSEEALKMLENLEELKEITKVIKLLVA